jgi:transcription antitermination factor NusG
VTELDGVFLLIHTITIFMIPLEKNWYAIYTRPRWEKKVAAALTLKQINNYCPVNTVLKQWSDRKKLVEEPLFSSYVFVRVAQDEMLKVIQTEGVLNFVRWLNKPAVIKNAEIELIRKYLAEYQYVRVEALKIG